VRGNARGVHAFGPRWLRGGDVLRCLSREVELSNRQYLLVYPLVVPITRFGLPARHPFGDFRAPRRLLEDPARVIGVRDYQYGDELRRVHWKATARAMQLQSKVYEATTTYTLILFLNVVTQLDVYYGIHPELQELAICAAASVSAWALDEGFAVGLYANTIMHMPEVGMFADEGGAINREDAINRTSTGLESVLAEQVKRRRIHLPPSSSEEQRKRLMEVLARIQTYFGNPIEDVIQAERTRLPAGALVEAFIGDGKARPHAGATKIEFVQAALLVQQLTHQVADLQVWPRGELGSHDTQGKRQPFAQPDQLADGLSLGPDATGADQFGQ